MVETQTTALPVVNTAPERLFDVTLLMNGYMAQYDMAGRLEAAPLVLREAGV